MNWYEVIVKHRRWSRPHTFWLMANDSLAAVDAAEALIGGKYHRLVTRRLSL